MVDRDNAQRSRKRRRPTQARQCRQTSQGTFNDHWTQHHTIELIVDSDSSSYTAIGRTELLWDSDYAERVALFMGVDDLGEKSKRGRTLRSGYTATSTPTTSTMDVGPGTALSPGTSSYVMLRRRADSTGSNHSSRNGSGSILFSLPSQGSSEWAPDDEHAVVELDIMDDESLSRHSMPRDQKSIIFSMCDPESIQLVNVYTPDTTVVNSSRHTSMSHEDSEYTESLRNYLPDSVPQICPYSASPRTSIHVNLESNESSINHTTDSFSQIRSFSNSPGPTSVHLSFEQNDFSSNHITDSVFRARSYSSSPRPTNLHVSFEPPWSHVMQHQYPSYEPESTAFAPSPGGLSEYEGNDRRHFVNTTSAAGSPRATPPRTMAQSSGVKSRTARTNAKDGAKSVEGWEHTIVKTKGGLQQLVAETGGPSKERNGIRKGPLEPKIAEKATGVRRQGACWNCWIQKVPCSIGQPCERCKKHFSTTVENICSNAHFKDYEPILFPEYLHSHFKKRKIEDLLNEHTSGFTDTALEVEVAAGACFRPMVFVANVFLPQTWELLGQHRLATDEEQQNSRLVLQNSAPVGLLGISTSEMKDKCKDHIDQMIKSEIYAEQVTAGDASRIPYTVLSVVQRFFIVTKEPLVRQVLMLHGIHYFMKSFLTFSDESARKLYQAMQEYGAPQDPYLSSRLLSRQIKYAMHLLSRDVTHDVLVGLERTMRSRTKDSWGTSFCAFLVLCLSMEGLQIAADTYVVCDMQKEGANSVYSREQSREACSQIDEHPFEQCKRLFHEIYRSHRKTQRVDREGGFNPPKNLAEGDAKGTGLDPAADEVMRAMFKMIVSSYPELVRLSENPALVNSDGYEFDPELIKANNTGRLVAKFLRSFFEDSWRPSV